MHDQDTHIVHWNIRGYRTNYQHLRLLLAHSNAVVMCLQETRMPFPLPSPPRGFQMYHKSGPPAADGLDHGGVCILVRDNIGHMMLPLITDLQAVAIRCQLDQLYTVCSLYLPPNNPLQLQQLEDLVAQLPSPFLLVGDFNARHHMWGDTAMNNKGHIIEKLLDTGLCGILNEGLPTHFHSATDSTSCIDLSLCSPDLLLEYSWSVSQDLYNSDHFPVRLSLSDQSSITSPPRYKYEEANWAHFRDAAVCARDADSFDTIDDAVEYFTNTLITAADTAIPKTSGRLRTKPVPWWNNDLRVAHSTKRAAMRRYYRTRLVEDKIAFNRARAHFHYLQKTARRDSWQRYVSKINERTPINKVWSMIKKIQGRYTGIKRPVLQHNGVLISDACDVADTLGSHLSEVSHGLQHPKFQQRKQKLEATPVVFPDDDGSDYNLPFTRAEFDEALRHCSNTAAGEDNVHYSMVKHLPEESVCFLLRLYNRIWTEECFPSSWRRAIILPFPKPRKDSLLCSNYRPIALTSSLCKLLEKMVNARMQWHLEHTGSLHPNQYGFRKGRSCPDVLARIDTFINQAFARKQHVVAVFFDIEKAYDTTWKHGILRELLSMQLTGPLPRFIQNFLNGRSFQVRLGTVLSQAYPQHEGVPQGSVLSCTLFDIAINSLAASMPPGIESSLYVDDFAVFTSSAHLPAAERRLQLALNAANAWSQLNGFKFSLSKTVSMHFTRLRGVFPPLSFHLGNSAVSNVKETKFLGMILDSKLYWTSHIRDLRARCLNGLQLLNCLSHFKWGADRTSLLRVYRSLIRSRLDYCCQIYASATASTLKTLDGIHHRALRLATGAFRSSPVASLYVETGEPSLAYRRDKLVLQMFVRVLSMPGTPAYTALTSTAMDHLHAARLYHAPLGYRARKLLLSLNIGQLEVLPSFEYVSPPHTMRMPHLCSGIMATTKSSIPDTVIREIFREHADTHNDATVPIYTDGSKSADGVGCAAVLPSRVLSARLPAAASVFSAELRAVLPALAFILRDSSPNYVLYSDSRSALQAICNPFSVHPIVREIHTWLRMLHDREKHMTFCWVPAHVGIPGNETADKEAAAAVRTQAHVAPIRLPFRDYFAYFASHLHSRRLTAWRATRDNKLRSIRDSITVFRTSCRKDRYEEVILARVRIGHTKLTHQHLMSGEPPPECESCDAPLTVCHILTECLNYVEERRAYFGVDGVAGVVSLNRVLEDSERAVASLFGFLRETRLITKL